MLYTNQIMSTNEELASQLVRESIIHHPSSQAAVLSSLQDPSTSRSTQMTCDALCSLSYSSESLPPSLNNNNNTNNAFITQQQIPELSVSFSSNNNTDKPKRSTSIGAGCSKQHQLPMFLSKTYHMIDRCDPSVATWASNGDSFVVKNVDRFASGVLPMYFKHSNFSSFARQLNFYGFRKLKAEPILTADFDARTACYVRFYHEKFQRSRPELLAQIKRATKSDQQSKDDVEILKIEISKLKECMAAMGSNYDRRMTEMSYEYNRRITSVSAEYDRLAVLVQQILANQGVNAAVAAAAATAPTQPKNNATAATHQSVSDMMHSLSQQVAAATANGNNNTNPSVSDMMHSLSQQVAAAATANGKNNTNPSVSDMMHSLSQVAAMSLQNSLRPPSLAAAAAGHGVATAGGPTSPYTHQQHHQATMDNHQQKRIPDYDFTAPPPATRARLS